MAGSCARERDMTLGDIIILLVVVAFIIAFIPLILDRGL